MTVSLTRQPVSLSVKRRHGYRVLKSFGVMAFAFVALETNLPENELFAGTNLSTLAFGRDETVRSG